MHELFIFKNGSCGPHSHFFLSVQPISARGTPITTNARQHFGNDYTFILISFQISIAKLQISARDLIVQIPISKPKLPKFTNKVAVSLIRIPITAFSCKANQRKGFPAPEEFVSGNKKIRSRFSRTAFRFEATGKNLI